MVEILTTAIVSNVLVMGILGYLSRNLITHLLSKDQRNHQNQLEIEKIRFQASIGWLYEKQAKAMSDLYKLTLELEGKVNAGIIGPKNWNEYQGQLGELRNHYHNNRIFLPELLDSKIKHIIEVGIKIMGKSVTDPFCRELLIDLGEAKESALTETRRLLAVVGKGS